MPQQHSILKRTLIAVGIATVTLMSGTGFFVFKSALDTALDFQDQRLTDIAAALARADVLTLFPSALTMDPEQFEQRLDSNDPIVLRRRQPMAPTEQVIEPIKIDEIPKGDTVAVRLMNRQGQLITLLAPHAIKEGVSNLDIDDERYRIAVLFLPTGHYTAVAEPLAGRNAGVLMTAMRAVAPLFILLPLLLAAIGWVLRRTLNPLLHTAQGIQARDATDLTPISLVGVPTEIQPLVLAMNHLLSTVQAARTREIRFTADAAHELRSPLAALTLEADRLAKLELSAEARAVVKNLEEGLERASHQVSQLLLFARAQSDERLAGLERERSPWSMRGMAATLFEELMPAFSAKHQIPAFEADEDLAETVIADVAETAVHIIARNLLENATRYTPEGGEITLEMALSPTTLTLVVRDTGPGIPESERARVFDPFYRIVGTGVSGTGLGLAIVASTVNMVGGKIELTDAAPGKTPPGLAVRVTLPRRMSMRQQ